MSCEACSSEALVRLSSIDKKLCADCLEYNEWALKPDQESILIRGKHGTAETLGNPIKQTHKRA